MTYKHSGKWDVGASGLLGGTHISLRPPCRSRTSRTPEWAPGTPHIASAVAVLVARGGEPADRVSSLRRGRAGGRAGPVAARRDAPSCVAVQAGPGDRSQAEGYGVVGREPARAHGVQSVRLDGAGHGLPVSAAARAGVATIGAGVSQRRPVPVSTAVTHRARRSRSNGRPAGARPAGGVSQAGQDGPWAGALGA